jgi:hypothetical protein
MFLKVVFCSSRNLNILCIVYPMISMHLCVKRISPKMVARQTKIPESATAREWEARLEKALGVSKVVGIRLVAPIGSA